jgi:hypothetical protein
MKSLARIDEEKAARERKRVWRWCRRENGFSDLPRWRVVAARCELPLFQVVAFVNRLEEVANDAGNKGLGRGEVSHFDAAEFAAALDMAGAEAERIFAALEEGGWVCDGHVADFWNRNKDEEDDTAALRQRRKRARATVQKFLAPLARMGLIAAALRTDLESRLPSLKTMADVELFALVVELERALSTRQAVTRDTRRDSVTVTGEKKTQSSSAAVDNSGTTGCSGTEGLQSGQGGGENPAASVTRDSRTVEEPVPDETQIEEARLWLETEGVRFVVELANEPRTRAAMLLERWGRDLDDPVLMVKIVAGAAETSARGVRFNFLIADQVKRWVGHKLHGAPLPLMPPSPRAGNRALVLATDAAAEPLKKAAND